ncbi:ankyrin repeat-containing protein BDA1-like [Hibiscus syriacus]|uniref:ankyrin repeat-containing protein BDA1-like n=1 Tax=Hibiscus syriacus TaxID=106335 RepID=UPI001921180A|nr:ankyrin repeat-containing protein BDA1-like [Hibiscus syriacus]
MDQSLRTAARVGNVSELYTLIHRNGNVLRRLDEVEFIETPLHIAAEEGCLGFAMEIMSLKPSFSRKLNQQGLSPMHLAVERGHKEMALRILEIDSGLARIKGKNGETPLHYINKFGNCDDLLHKMLEASPDCIRDVTNQNRTALHMAVENKRLDVLQVLIGALRRKDYYRETVNRKDEEGNTALHLAARNNQLEMVKLLLNCKADRQAKNQHGLTALEVAEQHNSRESVIVLRGLCIPIVSNFSHQFDNQIIKYVTKASSLIFHDMENISEQDRNTLLVILGLLLTATYQTSLSPPGGVWQADCSSSSPGSKLIERRESPGSIGTAVMDQYYFLLFYSLTYVVFIAAFFLTLALLKPFPLGIRTALQLLLAFLALCFDQSVSTIAPTFSIAITLRTFSTVIFVFMVFMCISYKVSKLSVSIVGCWIFPSFSLSILAGGVVIGVIQGFFIFLVLYDELWKGTLLVVGYNLFVSGGYRSGYGWKYPTAFVACWLLLNICRFCIKRCIKCCKDFQFNFNSIGMVAITTFRRTWIQTRFKLEYPSI